MLNGSSIQDIDTPFRSISSDYDRFSAAGCKELLEQTQSEAQLKIGQGTWLSQSDTEKTLLGWLSTTRAQLCQAYCAVTVYSEVLEYMVVSNAWSSHIVSTHVHCLFHCQKYERSEAVRLLDFFSLEAAEVRPTQNVTATQRPKPSTQSSSCHLPPCYAPEKVLGNWAVHLAPKDPRAWNPMQTAVECYCRSSLDLQLPQSLMVVWTSYPSSWPIAGPYCTKLRKLSKVEVVLTGYEQ